MKLRNLMTTDVFTISPDASLKEAARRMMGARVSGLPVTNDDGELVGIISEADFVNTEADRRKEKSARLLRFFDKDEVPSEEQLVADVMTEKVITLDPETDHPVAARLMKTAGVKRIPVVEDGRLVGLVSSTDVLKAFARPDSEILSEIEDRLMREILWIDPGRVNVTCSDGNITLAGRLETRSDATLLVELSRRLDGVVSVASGLTWVADNTKLEMVGRPPGVPRRTI